jgi:type IV pilus assembly protein PilE
MKSRNRGFTLIELMITVAIVGILAAVAVPAYRQYIVRAKRTEAISALADIAQRQERYRLDHGGYSNDLLDELGFVYPPDADYFYTLTDVTKNTFTATATASSESQF